jgi:hypothetical protein
MTERKRYFYADMAFNIAQDVANCTFCPIDKKKQVRRMILEAMVMAIEEYRWNPDILYEIKEAAKQ